MDHLLIARSRFARHPLAVVDRLKTAAGGFLGERVRRPPPAGRGGGPALAYALRPLADRGRAAANRTVA